MPLGNYQELRASVLSWLARPGDALIAPTVPDMIRLFEAEASRRLRVGFGEKQTVLVTTPGSPRVVLPADFAELRQVTCNGEPLIYLPPRPVSGATGVPRTYSLTGPAVMEGRGYRLARLDPTPNAEYEITILYLAGITPLSDLAPTNALLEQSPDAYLFGSLAEAEVFIGHDERIALWLQRRDAVFASIEQADRKARWPGGGQLQIRVDGITVATAGNRGGGFAPVPAAPPAIRVVNPMSAAAVTMLAGERVLYVDGGPRGALTIRLPPDPPAVVEVSFEAPVTALTVTNAAGLPVENAPLNAFGPGAGLEFRYVDGAWVYWS